MMYVFEYFIYHLKPYGISSSIVLPPGEKQQQQHPVSVATVSRKAETPTVASFVGHTISYTQPTKHVESGIVHDKQPVRQYSYAKKKAFLKNRSKSAHNSVRYLDKLLRDNKVEDDIMKNDLSIRVKEIETQS